MVVSCPKCQKRYHYRGGDAGPSDQALCSGCGTVVPLVEARPAFVVRAAVEPVAVGAAVGSGSSARSASAMAVAPAVSVAAAPPEPTPVDDAFRSPGVSVEDLPVVPGASTGGEGITSVESGTEAPASGEGTAWKEDVDDGSVDNETGATPTRKSHVGLQLLSVLILTSAFAAAGHFAEVYGWVWPIEVHPAVDPVRPALVGGLLGALVGWVLVRWTSPKR
jgi:hypothetical protein